MEPQAADGVGFMSKAEILRLVITERLTAAAQEIFAVVERTLAGYEEEVSGCRQELELQRNQLDFLLHRQIKVEREGRWTGVKLHDCARACQNCSNDVKPRWCKHGDMCKLYTTTIVTLYLITVNSYDVISVGACIEHIYSANNAHYVAISYLRATK